MKFCPRCGSEYVEGVERCFDCGVALVDEPVDPVEVGRPRPVAIDRVVIYTSGRRIDAEMVRGLLEARGIDATIWAGGMGAYRLESALTELTGVPNAFNGYRVAILPEDEEEARALLADDDATQVTDESENQERIEGLLGAMRSRWALVATALFLLTMVILFGPPGLD